jgi:hypothetical protein
MKNPSTTSFAIGICLAITLLAPASTIAGTVSPIQSTARPLRLGVVGPVQSFGSDECAADFQKNVLPKFLQFVNDNLGERRAIVDVSTIALDPGQLRLRSDSEVRAYFVGEGAGYQNSLGFFTSSYDPYAGLKQTDAQLIFPNASSSITYLADGQPSGGRTSSAPLLPGDFVDLGALRAGTQINPFLIADGANRGTTVFTADPSRNPDRLQHFVSLVVLAVKDSPFLLMSVEDLLGGGDRDYNDLVFALDIGASNVKELVSATVPLPPAVLALLGPCLWSVKRLLGSRRLVA